MYKHFLVTRFNVKNRDWTADKNRKPIKNDDWLKNRFQLFDQFCFPSIRSNQATSQFVWLVFFDTDTPTEFRACISEYERTFSYFKPVFIDDMDELSPALKREIATNVDSDTRYVITTRVDNDDSLHQDAMQTIHSFAEQNDIKSGIIDITRGLCVQVAPTLEIRSCIYYSSPFISFVEPFTGVKELRTVMQKPHHKWFYRTATYELADKPLWIQLIHQKNMANQMQGRLETSKDILSGFILNYDLGALLHSPVNVFTVNYLKYPIYRLKKVLKKIYLNIDARLESMSHREIPV